MVQRIHPFRAIGLLDNPDFLQTQLQVRDLKFRDRVAENYPLLDRGARRHLDAILLADMVSESAENLVTEPNFIDGPSISPAIAEVDLDGLRVADLVLDCRETYLHFGDHFVLDAKSGLQIEGAYLRGRCDPDALPDDFEILLVSNASKPFALTVIPAAFLSEIMYGSSYYKWDKSFLLADMTHGQSGAITSLLPGGSNDTVRRAIDFAVRTVVFMMTCDADFELGFDENAPRHLVEQSEWDDDASDQLFSMGYSRMFFYRPGWQHLDEEQIPSFQM